MNRQLAEIVKKNRLILCSGMPRSASTWSYNVIYESIHQFKKGQKSFQRIGYFDKLDLDNYLVENYINKSNIVLLAKSHFPSDLIVQFIEDGFIKNIYTMRDPRDAVVSIMKKFNSSLENGIKSVKDSIIFIEKIEKNSLLIDYQEIMNFPERALIKIMKYLDETISQDKLESIIHKNNIENIKNKIEENKLEKKKLKKYKDGYYHLDNLYHENHIINGNDGQYLDYLTKDQIDAIENEFSSWIFRHKYK